MKQFYKIDCCGRATIPNDMRKELGLLPGVSYTLEKIEDGVIVRRQLKEVRAFCLEMTSNKLDEIKTVKVTDDMDELMETFMLEYTDCLMKGFHLEQLENIEQARASLSFGEEIILKNDSDILIAYRMTETTIMK